MVNILGPLTLEELVQQQAEKEKHLPFDYSIYYQNEVVHRGESMKIAADMTQLIENTPLVRLNRVNEGLDA